MQLALWSAALFGHGLLWAALLNRLHAVGIPRRLNRTLTAGCFAAVALLPLVLALWVLPGEFDILRPWSAPPRLATLTLAGYVALCWAVLLVAVAQRMQGALRRPPEALLAHRRQPVVLNETLAAATVGREHHFLAHLPGNQILDLELSETEVRLPRLPPALDGLSLVHLSDLHFSGRIGKSYFRQVVRYSNELRPDLIAITGDLVDKSKYVDWVPEILGELQAPCGVFCILGNHDAKADVPRLRAAVAAVGLVELGGRFIEISVRGQTVVIAGNERPWFPIVDELPPLDQDPRRALRILLAHSPDQLGWARRRGVDLMLVGHTHGGQIRFPLLGAVLTPSWRGVKYASGVFYREPTVMHVTRGVSGEVPLRYRCPPEVCRLVLRAP